MRFYYFCVQDSYFVFDRGPGDCQKRTAKDTSKPQVKKSEIGTTTISSYKSPKQNSLGK